MINLHVMYIYIYTYMRLQVMCAIMCVFVHWRYTVEGKVKSPKVIPIEIYKIGAHRLYIYLNAVHIYTHRYYVQCTLCIIHKYMYKYT